MPREIDKTRQILTSQTDGELVEIDSEGNIYTPNVQQEVKPTILRDPRGEY